MTLRVHGDRFLAPGLLDFAVNVRRTRPSVLEDALSAALAEPGYPDDRLAREAIAHRHGRRPEEVLPLNGACEGFWLLAHALRPATATCVHPAFGEGEAALRAVGADVRQVIALDALEPGAVPDAEFVVVTNPGNPTGRLDPAEVIAALAHPGRTLLVDESFMELAGDRESLASRADLAGLVVLRSVTKLWSLAGIRAGYLLADESLVARLEGQRQPWSVNALACAALRVCAEERDLAKRLAAEVADARAELAASLAALPGVEVRPSETNFLLLELPVDDGAERLRESGIAVRPAGGFPGLDDRFVRVAVRTPAENAVLVAALREALR